MPALAAYAHREGYQEMPAVRPGGKASFYYRRHPDTDERQWIVWRADTGWTFQLEDADTGTVREWPFWTTEED